MSEREGREECRRCTKRSSRHRDYAAEFGDGNQQAASNLERPLRGLN